MLSRPTLHRVSRRNLLKLGGAAAAAGAFGFRPGESFADGDPPPEKAKQPDRGGTFRIRIARSPAHFDPHQTAAYSTMVPLSFAYSRLVMIKPGTTIVPGTQPLDSDLAQSWDRVGDTVYVFRLRQGVRWQPKPPVNGRELTADDVKYTYDRFLATKGNPNRALLEIVDKVEAPDKYTVKFTLKEPNAWFLDRMASPRPGSLPGNASKSTATSRSGNRSSGPARGCWSVTSRAPGSASSATRTASIQSCRTRTRWSSRSTPIRTRPWPRSWRESSTSARSPA